MPVSTTALGSKVVMLRSQDVDLGCLAAAVICAIASHKQHHAQAATWPHARILATPASAVQAYVYCCAASPCCAAQMNKGANDVPIVDPPERVAGYFKLNRTVDAHMFYFFYESRCGNCCQKGMKFDWQQCTWTEVAVLGLLCTVQHVMLSSLPAKP